ncbi:hypothetical protein [Liquorilactobacillus satsumensis]|nr:hypothetical protein [Liquorilactobacillus satsumensis]MCC7665966.1 hypothetical protein [Liquorilactobacillus satsumensis]MCP9312074.1 hypothetical protein [Liquorilactobacillus satsumensis]MCP9327839.1 hypothetical protein [Liquorilactobacillus satsumensis]
MKEYDPDFLDFVQRLGEWFHEAEQNQYDISQSEEAYDDDIAMIAVISELNTFITKNEALLENLFNTYRHKLE